VRLPPPPLSRPRGSPRSNTAVTEMDKVTQQNAANAEESASAAEEMNAQAEEMKASVDELMKLVGGSEKGHGRTATRSVDAISHSTHHALAIPAKKVRKRQRVAHTAKELSPDQVIPMDDQDFQDF
jgi:methyl-accepting chemotaxis protein